MIIKPPYMTPEALTPVTLPEVKVTLADVKLMGESGPPPGWVDGEPAGCGGRWKGILRGLTLFSHLRIWTSEVRQKGP